MTTCNRCYVHEATNGDKCQMCTNRAAEGMHFWTPSNGSEGDCFFYRCESCKHFQTDDGWPTGCDTGIATKVLDQKVMNRDAACFWFDPADLYRGACKRFSDRDDNDGTMPPIPDCPGQMTLGEIDVPVERAANDAKLIGGAS
jgi:hypothetical protein